MNDFEIIKEQDNPNITKQELGKLIKEKFYSELERTRKNKQAFRDILNRMSAQELVECSYE